MDIKELEEAIRVIGPMAAMCGIKKENLELIIDYVDKMSKRGISGTTAAIALRRITSEKAEQFLAKEDLSFPILAPIMTKELKSELLKECSK